MIFEMGAGNEEENPIWAALTEPLSSFVGGHRSESKADEIRRTKSEAHAEKVAKTEEYQRKRYRKRIQNLQMEVEDVNEAATSARRQLWDSQDKLKDSEDQIRKLENHLNELLELREKDLGIIKSLRAANSDCVENESRAREAMDVFKKCYKRAQIQIKENEEEIAVLREHRELAERGKDKTKVYNTAAMVNESALEYIQTVSNDKEKRLKQMVAESESEADLWKSKFKVAHKRCMNWQEQVLAMEHPTEGADHIKRQRIEIDKLEEQVRQLQEKEKHVQSETEQRERREIEERDTRTPFDNIIQGTFCNEDLRDDLKKSLIDGFQNLNQNLNCSSNMSTYAI